MDLLSINSGMFWWSAIVFILLVVLLKKMAWGPMLSAIDEREARINHDIESATKANKDAEELLAKHKELVANAEAQAADIVNSAKHTAEKIAESVKEDAKAQAKQILVEAEAKIMAEKDAAFNELRSEIANLAVGAANKIILANLDADKQHSLVDEYIKAMPSKLN